MYIFLPLWKVYSNLQEKTIPIYFNLEVKACFLTDLSKKIDFSACLQKKLPSKEITLNYPVF